jgi:hypothetical protein
MSDLKLIFKSKHFDKGDIITIGQPPTPTTPWYLRIFGFKYQHAIYVVDSPILKDGYFEYNIKIKNKKLKWIWKEKLLNYLK